MGELWTSSLIWASDTVSDTIRYKDIMIEEFMTRRVYVAFWVPNFLLQHGLGAGKRGYKLWLMFLGSHPSRQAWMQSLSLSLSYTNSYMHTALFLNRKRRFFNSRVFLKSLPSFFPGKRWNHLFILDQLQALESTGGRESLNTNKYTLGEAGMEETVIDWPCKICCWIDSNFWKRQTFILCGLNSRDNKRTYEVGLLTLFPWAPYKSTHT